MKLTRTLGTFAALALVSSSASAVMMEGSAHDLSDNLLTADSQICIVCHAPHNNQNAAGELLWNRAMTSTTFTAYSSATLDGASSGPGATSLLCLSCHDGTINVDAYGGTTTTGISLTALGQTPFGADLGQDHPIGVVYGTDSGLADSGTFYGPGSTIADYLFDGKVECASCHDVHNEATGSNNALLVESLAASGICQKCHEK